MGSDKGEKKSCCQKCFCVVTTLTILAAIGVVAWYFAVFAKDVEDATADCGGCYCVPDNSTSNSCPSRPAPPSFYPAETHLDAWKSQEILDPYVLNCNPFEDGILCDTEPPLDPDFRWRKLGETAVCAVHYEAGPADGELPLERGLDGGAGANATVFAFDEGPECGDFPASYRIKTYPSRGEAEAAGGFVTHVGNCGVCSTLQDLAVYANTDFVGVTSPGNFCRRQAASSLENGLSCYLGLGMTQDCAKIWADTSWNTAKNCFGKCVLGPTLPQFGGENEQDSNSNSNETSSSGKWYNVPANIKKWFNSTSSDENKSKSAIPSNGPAPDCVLNACIRCNDEFSSEIFELFAGRSRRRSGLLSTAARPCGSIPNIEHQACPITEPLLPE